MYDKAEKVMRNLSSIIFDLRAENESLYDTIEMYSARIDELREENEHLRTELNTTKLKIEKTNKLLNANTHIENIYHGICNLFDEAYQYEIDNEEILNILEGNNDERKSN